MGYSAEVDLKLIMDGEVIDACRTGPESFGLREPRDLPAGPADLVIIVDGHETWHPIIVRATKGPATTVYYW